MTPTEQRIDIVRRWWYNKIRLLQMEVDRAVARRDADIAKVQTGQYLADGSRMCRGCETCIERCRRRDL
jgi:ferredoxin